MGSDRFEGVVGRPVGVRVPPFGTIAIHGCPFCLPIDGSFVAGCPFLAVVTGCNCRPDGAAHHRNPPIRLTTQAQNCVLIDYGQEETGR